MEEILNYLVQYAVFPIAVICFGVGYLIKHFIPRLPNKFIPLILAVLGLILNLAFNSFKFTFDIIVTGIASGLVATGSFELVRNLANKQNKTTETKVEETTTKVEESDKQE